MSECDRIDHSAKAVVTQVLWCLSYSLTKDPWCSAVCLGFTQTLTLGLYHTIWQATIMAMRVFTGLYSIWELSVSLLDLKAAFSQKSTASKSDYESFCRCISWNGRARESNANWRAKHKNSRNIWPETSAVLGHLGIEVTSLSVLLQCCSFFKTVYAIYSVCSFLHCYITA